MNMEEIDFGDINESKYKTVILYIYSNKYSFDFTFIESGFLIKVKLKIIPIKDIIEMGKYKLIKCILNPMLLFNSEYESDVLVLISWITEDNLLFSKYPKRKSLIPIKDLKANLLQNSAAINSKVHTTKKRKLYLRIIKKAKMV